MFIRYLWIKSHTGPSFKVNVSLENKFTVLTRYYLGGYIVMCLIGSCKEGNCMTYNHLNRSYKCMQSVAIPYQSCVCALPDLLKAAFCCLKGKSLLEA